MGRFKILFCVAVVRGAMQCSSFLCCGFSLLFRSDGTGFQMYSLRLVWHVLGFDEFYGSGEAVRSDYDL